MGVSQMPRFYRHRRDHRHKRWLLRWRAQQMTRAGPEIVTGGVSAPHALHPHPMSRTIADGFPGRAERSDAEAAWMS